MIFLGLLITLLGFVISFHEPRHDESVNVRMVMVLIGIAVSFSGIFGVINRALPEER